MVGENGTWCVTAVAVGRPDAGDDEAGEEMAGERTKDEVGIAPGVHGQSDGTVVTDDEVQRGVE